MNLIEQMNVLKGLDDAMLQQEVKAPSGSVPPYLVLSEMNRRKDMRQRYEGELARRKPQTTVAADMMAGLQPGGPMAAAPAIDPAAMGSGAGIAAAVPGGGAPGFADGGIVDLAGIKARYNDKLAGLNEDRDRARALALIAASAGMLSGGHSNTLQNVGLGINAGVQSYGDALNTIDSREAGFLKDLTDLDLAEQDSNYRERAFALQQAQEGRLSNPPPAYGQTPIFMYDNQDPPQPHMAQPSTGGGFLIEGKLYPGVPTGWSLTNRPVALRVEDTGTNLTTIDTNLGPTAGAAVDVAPIDNAGKKFDEAVGTGLGAQIAEARTAASDAQASMAANDRAIQLLDDGVITGFGADFRVGMGKALQQVGVHLADDEIANTEAFVASRALEVGRLIKMFGAGTGLSDADREFATKAAGGNISMNEESIRRILRINNEVAQEAYDKAQTLLAPIAGRSSIPSEVLAVPTPKPGAASGQVGNVTFTVEP